MIFQSQNQRISASKILAAMAGGQAVKLHRCTITGELDVNRLFAKDENFDSSNLNVSVADEKMTLTLPEPITFDSCTFQDNVLFASPWDRPGKLEVVFKKDVVFNSSVFSGQTRFSKTLFCALAGFDGCVFNRIAAFRNAIFCGQAKYRTVAFKGYGLFNDSVFRTEAGFTNSCFSKGGNFTNVRFEGKADFAGVYSESKSVPVYGCRFMGPSGLPGVATAMMRRSGVSSNRLRRKPGIISLPVRVFIMSAVHIFGVSFAGPTTTAFHRCKNSAELYGA
jgi:hypothetical protein